MNVLRAWFDRYFSDPQVVILSSVLLFGLFVVLIMGNMLAPVLAAIVIAYLLGGLVNILVRKGMPNLFAVILVFVLFLFFLLFAFFGLIPSLSNQITQLIQQFPAMVGKGHEVMTRLLETYPNAVSEQQLNELMTGIRAEIASFGQRMLSLSLASIMGLVTLLVYLLLVPLLVFFFLKDKRLIIEWCASFLPKERGLSTQVWSDVNQQIGNYVRGKAWEVVIVGLVTYVAFYWMGLEYAVLLSTLVGLSVIVPYIGAAVVTIPVFVIAYFQWGWEADLAYLMLIHGVIQAVDGNVLVPLLFSEVVNLHPVAIIVAVLVFGGLWGFWGVFFAIPLATLVQAVLKAWPCSRSDSEAVEGS
ncbi:MAG: AI-2E family transporter [Gammaproteobacteria bacterium]|nr:AI-2E family transporter [Gammaproteobacteria bacterium]